MLSARAPRRAPPAPPPLATVGWKRGASAAPSARRQPCATTSARPALRHDPCPRGFRRPATQAAPDPRRRWGGRRPRRQRHRGGCVNSPFLLRLLPPAAAAASVGRLAARVAPLPSEARCARRRRRSRSSRRRRRVSLLPRRLLAAATDGAAGFAAIRGDRAPGSRTLVGRASTTDAPRGWQKGARAAAAGGEGRGGGHRRRAGNRSWAEGPSGHQLEILHPAVHSEAASAGAGRRIRCNRRPVWFRLPGPSGLADSDDSDVLLVWTLPPMRRVCGWVGR